MFKKEESLVQYLESEHKNMLEGVEWYEKCSDKIRKEAEVLNKHILGLKNA